MERLTVFALLFCVGSIATGEISTTVYLADGSTPLESADPNVPFIYRDIMVGTKLTIVVSSDANEGWSGSLDIATGDSDYGAISARDYNEITRDWEGSHLEAAGTGAKVRCYASLLATSISMETRGIGAPGDWFIIDYDATNVGTCRVDLYEPVFEPCPNCDPFDPPPVSDVLVHELVFSHVPTRDFIRDGKVDFADFAALTSFIGATNCVELNWCEGTDLDTDGDVDNGDLVLFADYWLESTQ